MSSFSIIFEPTDTEAEPLPDLDALAAEFQEHDWSIPEAFMALIIAAAFADHDLADEERDEIAALIRRSRTMKRLSSSELANVNQTVNRKLQEKEDALSDACQALPPDMRISVFAHCVDIVLADGKLLPSEAQFLNDVTQMMKLPAEKAKEVMSVMLQKNRY